MFITRRQPLAVFETPQDGGGGTSQAPAQPDTPASGQPADQQHQDQSQQINWEKRYSDLQPEFTRTSQEAASLRQQVELMNTVLFADDQDTRLQAAQALGIELDEPENEDTSEAAPYLTREEWAAYQQQQQAQAQAQQQEQGIARVETYMDDQLKSLDVPAHIRNLVKADAVFNRDPNSDGMPDIKGAFDAYINEVRVAEQKAWRETKRAPHISAGGREGTQAPPLNTHQDRVEYMVQLARDAEIG